MSSSPKYCEYQLAAQRQAELELARRQQAAEEAKRRKQAEQRERKRRLDLLRTQLIAEAQELKTNVQRQQAIYPQDLIHLTSRCDSLLDALHRGKNERELQNTAQESISISQSLSQAVSQKRRDDEEKERHLEIDIQNFQIIDLEHQINSIQVADATKFDAAGYNAARQAMAEVKSALTSGQPHLVRDPLLKAADLVQRHTTAVAHGHAEWMQRKVE
ncbi:MAG: hypothetical protein JOZ57_15595, partial [Abitibacteriaceae bacterium]|nr:hypothetical protein [Abditibacteriaceae bacterium]